MRGEESVFSRAVGTYARFLARNPKLVLAIIIIFTIVMGVAGSKVKTKSMNYEEMLPKSVDEIGAMFTIIDEFGMTSSTVYVVVKADGSGAADVLDPTVLRYMDRLTGALLTNPYIDSASSILDVILPYTNGTIPSAKSDVLRAIHASEIRCYPPAPSPQEAIHQAAEAGFQLSEVSEKVGEAQLNMSYGLSEISAGLSSLSLTLKTISRNIREGKMDTKALEDAYVQLYTLNYAISTSPTLSQQEKDAMLASLAQLEDDLNSITNAFQNIGYHFNELAGALDGMAMALEGISASLQQISAGMNASANASMMVSEALVNLSSGLQQLEIMLSTIVPQQKHTIQCIRTDPLKGYVSDDRTLAVIHLSVYALNEDQSAELVKELEEVVEDVPAPPGVVAELGGGIVYGTEIKMRVGEIMRKTSTISLLSILIIVCLILYSVRFGLTSLAAILFGTIWVYGMFGLMGVDISPSTSGAISMIMGIGIDFGIQVVNRFRQELRNGDVERAAETAIKRTFYPMLITTLAALIGFRAMGMGTITILKDLGAMMSYGVAMCFIAAITVVPALAVIVAKGSYRGGKSKVKK